MSSERSQRLKVPREVNTEKFRNKYCNIECALMHFIEDYEKG